MRYASTSTPACRAFSTSVNRFASRGPASGCPTKSQFFAPNFSGRIAFSTALLSSRAPGVVTHRRERRALGEQVADGLPERALRRQHEPVGRRAREERLGEGHAEARAPGRHACGVVRMRGGDASRAGVEAEEAVELRDVRPRARLAEAQRLDKSPARMRPTAHMGHAVRRAERVEPRRAVGLQHAAVVGEHRARVRGRLARLVLEPDEPLDGRVGAPGAVGPERRLARPARPRRVADVDRRRVQVHVAAVEHRRLRCATSGATSASSRVMSATCVLRASVTPVRASCCSIR